MVRASAIMCTNDAQPPLCTSITQSGRSPNRRATSGPLPRTGLSGSWVWVSSTSTLEIVSAPCRSISGATAFSTMSTAVSSRATWCRYLGERNMTFFAIRSERENRVKYSVGTRFSGR